MAEEHGFQSPEGHRLCANNCGFFGSPATQNFCSKCYHDLCLENSADSTSVFPAPLTTGGGGSSAPAHHAAAAVSISLPEKAQIQAAPAAANRCSACRKKVGLTGFRCRCGVTFCGTHRYPEKHACSFDFKSVGREAIAKANPLVKAEKLERI
ncbi:hypothetical protein SASPL_111762 [Salvia splendens]|uniref:Zinc finger A20 and AN1 domain-containing stress-associated protein 4 n=1 Tax=Salvia splendens TaxID=180675 RepID=A0A8X8YD27_SALSN|nr:zinc finger A20 and AN1 domain-containing stress-associated protein 6-like [Salvia splendens]KAG6427516.1 hypothetical protein SASPL_111762 [Salvia splendens]